jgi:hypothetical protein
MAADLPGEYAWRAAAAGLFSAGVVLLFAATIVVIKNTLSGR